MKMIFIAYIIAFSTIVCAEEYHGQKDRYNVAILRQDSEVLISPARKPYTTIEPVVYNADPKDSVVVATYNEPVIVTAKLCDEDSCMDMSSNIIVTDNK